jgi:hypothetical protein
MASSSLVSSKSIPEYTWWDQVLYEKLTSSGQKAYLIAARLHNGIMRKDGSPYLEHINRSLRFFLDNIILFGTKFDRNTMEKNICLHDCAEDHDEGIKDIESQYGDDTLVKILWMSEPNARIRTQLPMLVERLPEHRRGKYESFIKICSIIEHSSPEDTDIVLKLSHILPEWRWTGLWKLFQEKYNQETDPVKRKDIFAEWIFQGMIQNMPEDVFLAKSCERIDNLWDMKWLKSEKWWLSFQKTLTTTSTTYLPRISRLGYRDLHNSMRGIAIAGMREMISYMPRVHEVLSIATVSPYASLNQKIA